MKAINKLMMIGAAICTLGLSSCVKDLEVTPIDPNIKLPQDILKDQDAFTRLLAKVYQGLACSTSSGPDASEGDIKGVDNGYGQYIRAMFHLQCLTTDEAICSWNDQTLYDIHNLCWSSSDTFVSGAYYRAFFQISLANEFIRQAKATSISGFDKKDQYIAEARALRLLSYYHAIDLFANVPFSTEENNVGSTGPQQKKRADLWQWMVDECKDLLSSSSSLPKAGQTEYGRIDQGSVQMILAKLYLNAQVWKDPSANFFKECADVCKELMSEYDLHPKFSDLFCADNHLWTRNTTYNGDEIIFAVPHDGISIQSYGGTNYIIFASSGDPMDGAKSGITSGWSGLTVTPEHVDLFEEGDERAMFWTGFDSKDLIKLNDWKSGGYKSMKFSNINHDGSAASSAGFVDTDFPMFRVADAYLMLAECAKRGGASEAEGLSAINDIRERAKASKLDSYTLQDVINERGRELAYELVRRQDLIRFDMFTTDKYLWQWKGGAYEGKAVDNKYNVFPIISSDANANGNLEQNEGY